MYSKDTALSSGKQQSRRDEAAEEEEKKENSVQKDKVRFKGLPEVIQSDFGTRCLSHSRGSAIIHSLVITVWSLSHVREWAFSGQREVSQTMLVDPVKDGEKDFSWVCLMLQLSWLLLGNRCPLVYIKPISINYYTSSRSTKQHQIYSTRYVWLHYSFFHLSVWHPHPWLSITLEPK